ncbi:cytochrome C oxidase Cbb3 [Blastopirellula marina]|uniref:Cytochrome C oxidase Cbb3 n=1 Tax=Blastopirellula marina TaxID=124 RepID=A0A2S8F051_9BACT|nr:MULTISPECIES: cbb3-type cytochrome c oxidase N-terminal domain-containing protein [Pirellulaceae]PQO25294.1 cytochrome C oxidase Cbb3 [Blastopirellula marina]RCS41727.1 cytochrome C oxidase Cbb3 [Bremerella cremea]
MSTNTETKTAADDGGIPSDPLTDHSYDGIQEFDNPMPGWWKMLFLLSILYSIGYWVYYENGITPNRSIIAAYDRALAANLQQQFAEIGDLQPTREIILKFADDPKWLKVGEVAFQTNCTSCHGTKAEGRVGPNLTDEKWKNVKKVEDIAKVINHGAAGNAMPAWQNKLHPNEVVLLSSYLLSLKGSIPSGAGMKSIPGEIHEISDLTAAPATEEAPADTTTKPAEANE